MKVLIAAGGTAGHVNPAIAVASELLDDEVMFVGTRSGAEARIVADAGHRLRTIDVAGFDRSRPLTFPVVGLRAFGAARASRRIVRTEDPDVVLGMGGYVSLPVCLAARTAGVPVVLHEQNIVLGLAHRVCRPVARKIAVSFQDSVAEVGRKAIFTGNPVRSELLGVDLQGAAKSAVQTHDLDPDRRTLLVFGGSQGAQRLNDAASGLARIWADRADLQILHISGHGGFERVAAATAGVAGSLIYRVVAHVESMVDAYAVADLALCRGGATTVAELAVTGVPSIIVPYPHHRDRQQERHGRVFERAGAAIVLADADANAERIATEAERLLGDDDRWAAMGAAARELGRPDAARKLAAVVRGVAGR